MSIFGHILALFLPVKRERALRTKRLGSSPILRTGSHRSSTLFPPLSHPDPPPPRLSTETRNRSSGIKAAVLSSAAAGAALGLANHYSPAFRAALGPSGRAAMVALPALGVVFLEVEWKINACAMRQRYADKPTAVEPEDILPKRSG